MHLRLLALIFGLLSGSQLWGQSIDLPFFVFNNGLLGEEAYATPRAQARLLAELGYDGMEKNGLDGIFLVKDALENEGLKLYTVYVEINLDQPEQPWDPRLPEVLSGLDGSETMLWLYVRSQQYAPSTEENDAIAVPILQRLADMAQPHGVRLMLYPHLYFWVESPDDALRVARKVNRRNLGMTFNLCHYLAHEAADGRDPWERLPALAEACQPYLFALSLNGADPVAADPADIWTSYIQPLGQGRFEVGRFLQTFVTAGFAGPVGLQGYNLTDPPSAHLRQSMQAWQQLGRP
ncbi:MAG: hypothetical protein D6722_07070 [Bacteroidetes bacterium]|nr:MAG: hypothetical protein D6722_07070 [Bacteroidota bacterium]